MTDLKTAHKRKYKSRLNEIVKDVYACFDNYDQKETRLWYTFRNLLRSISNESEAAYMDRLIDLKFEQIRDHLLMMTSLKGVGSVSAHFLMTVLSVHT